MFWQPHMKQLVPVFTLLLAVGSYANADAALVSVISGNTNPGDILVVSGTINFGFYDRNGGTSGDVFGTGVSSFDTILSSWTGTTGNYLYLYQAVNNGINTEAIGRSTVTLLPLFVANPISSFGVVAGKGFADDMGEVDYSNPFGTNDGVFFDQDGPTPGVLSPSIVDITGGVTPVLSVSYTVPTGGSFGANFSGANSLVNLGRSVLYGFTSNALPVYGRDQIIDGSTSAGTVLTPTPFPEQSVALPEPASLAIWGLGGLALALFARPRRKK